MEILNSRILLHPVDLATSQAFYRDILGLAVYREFGPSHAPGMVFFCGNGLLEVSGHAEAAQHQQISLWFQVRDVAAEYDRLTSRGATALRGPRTEPWGLMEAWIADPDGIEIVLVQIPEDHPLRRDQR